MASEPERPRPLAYVNCPACGEECVVIVEVAQVTIARPHIKGDTGSLNVDFEQACVEHRCPL